MSDQRGEDLSTAVYMSLHVPPASGPQQIHRIASRASEHGGVPVPAQYMLVQGLGTQPQRTPSRQPTTRPQGLASTVSSTALVGVEESQPARAPCRGPVAQTPASKGAPTSRVADSSQVVSSKSLQSTPSKPSLRSRSQLSSLTRFVGTNNPKGWWNSLDGFFALITNVVLMFNTFRINCLSWYIHLY